MIILSFQTSFAAYGNASSKADCCSRSSSPDAGSVADENSIRFGTRSVFTALSGILVMFQLKNVSPEALESRFNYRENATNSVYYYISAAARAYKLPIYNIRLNDHNINDINKIIQSNLMSDSRVIVTYESDNKQHSVMVYGQLLDANALVTGYIVNDPAVNAVSDIIDAKTLTSQFWKLKVTSLYWFK
jgi:hypothetical protein